LYGGLVPFAQRKISSGAERPVVSTLDTLKALANIVDEGLFERLATEILRIANPLCAELSQPGVNEDGKTIKSPLDAIGFVSGAKPPHLIAVHHTTTDILRLHHKWLNNPATVISRRNGRKPTAPAGDLIKTAELVAKERLRTPDLQATLFLTTNEEPAEQLILDVNAAAARHGLNVSVWSRSQLAHVLDTDPTGQWIRRTYLGIEQERLSEDLLQVLLRKNFDAFRLRDEPLARVPRSVERVIATTHRPVTFLFAGSGLGKSVLCYRVAEAYVNSGAYSLFISHETAERSATLEQAVSETIRNLHPALAASETPLTFCSAESPLLVIVEDISRSGQPQWLVEKISKWANSAVPDGGSRPWRLICPISPQILSGMDDQTLRHLQPMLTELTRYSALEARKAVLQGAAVAQRVVSNMSADGIATALGNDPLLIGLYDFALTPDPQQVLSQYIETALRRTQTATGELSAELRRALIILAEQMILRRALNPRWDQVASWNIESEALRFIKCLSQRNELIGITGTSADFRLTFRHDRVRDWLLVESAAEMETQGRLPDPIAADPFYSEVIAGMIVRRGAPPALTARIRVLNPLSLFFSLVNLNGDKGLSRIGIVAEIEQWIVQPENRSPGKSHLRQHALAALEHADGNDIPHLVRLFPEDTTFGQLARLRNGDLNAAISLCAHIEPGSHAAFRDRQIQHARLRFGNRLTLELVKLLQIPDLTGIQRVGLLRFAGHVGDANLAPAISACWATDTSRIERLDDYLWAFAECCEMSNAALYLGPLCNAWAALPSQSENNHSPSPRDKLAADHVRWAFERFPPLAAFDYFIERASEPDLNWPIVCMLHGTDHPKVIVFIANALADLRRKHPDGIIPIWHYVKDHWKRRQREADRPMSEASRKALLEIWQAVGNETTLRRAAFDMWASAQSDDDIAVLNTANIDDELQDRILQQRLERSDQTAIPALVKRIEESDNSWWWHFARRLWSSELTSALDRALTRRGASTSPASTQTENGDYQFRQALMRMPIVEAEGLLLKHWRQLGLTEFFVQTALFIATPPLCQLVAASVAEAPNRKELFKHISMHYETKTVDHPGVTREGQIESLAPYLDLIDSFDLTRFAEACNEAGWFGLRKRLFDSRVQDSYTTWRPESAKRALDQHRDSNRALFVDFDVDRSLKTGTTWEEYRVLLQEWLSERRSIEALNVVAHALQYKGSRSDLGILTIYPEMPREAAETIIANASFSVYRRSIE
jgi:hypothetical protein